MTPPTTGGDTEADSSDPQSLRDSILQRPDQEEPELVSTSLSRRPFSGCVTICMLYNDLYG